ncbi:MAG: ADP-ribosyltransferase [Methanobacteriaceae archaeon]|jgi:hypothetical protein|nr:ADP-ribosyltransferase [Methanobacteriaceae archaeon]
MYKIYDKNSFHELKKYYWKASLEEKLAIKIFTTTKPAELINDILRNKKPLISINLNENILDKEKIETIISVLNSITQINRLTRDTKLFRGIEYGSFMEEWFKNNKMHENGFSSTSFNKEIAFQHVNKKFNDQGVR